MNKQEFRTTVYVGTKNGKHIRKTVRANSKRELNKKVAQLKAEIEKGKDVYTIALFGDWADKWYEETKVGSGIGQSSLTVIQSTIKHLKRYFENEQLKDIKLSMFQNMINELVENNPNTNKPSSLDLLKKITNNAKSIFEYAAANDVAFVPSFFSQVKLPKETVEEQASKRRSLSETEIDYVVNTFHRAQLPAMIMLFSGLRRGECISLEWSDINLNKRYINVSKSIKFGKNQGKIKKGGKTIKSSRIVPIPPILVEYLTNYKKTNNTGGIVCSQLNGKHHSKSSWDKMWASYMLELNLKYGYEGKVSKYNPKIKVSELPFKIEPFTPHFLRHTFCTFLYLQGKLQEKDSSNKKTITVIDAMRILGHTDIQTTVNIYTDFETLKIEELSDDFIEKLKTIYAI